MRCPAIASLILLSACSSISLPGVARLNALSPMETDPADIAVALALPEGLALQPGSAVFSIKSGTKDGTRKSNETYVLARTPGSDGSTVYQIAMADWDRVRAQQKLVRRWEEEDPRGHSGGFGVSLMPCTVGDGPADGAVLSISMRTNPDDAFFSLVKNAPWEDALDETGLDALEPC